MEKETKKERTLDDLVMARIQQALNRKIRRKAETIAESVCRPELDMKTATAAGLVIRVSREYVYGNSDDEPYWKRAVNIWYWEPDGNAPAPQTKEEALVFAERDDRCSGRIETYKPGAWEDVLDQQYAVALKIEAARATAEAHKKTEKRMAEERDLRNRFGL